jgi:hypothetical protein
MDHESSSRRTDQMIGAIVLSLRQTPAALRRGAAMGGSWNSPEVHPSIKGDVRDLDSQAVGHARRGSEYPSSPRASRVPDGSSRAGCLHAGSEPPRALAGDLPYLQRDNDLALLENGDQRSELGL